jgi:hypothetical protein
VGVRPNVHEGLRPKDFDPEGRGQVNTPGASDEMRQIRMVCTR